MLRYCDVASAQTRDNKLVLYRNSVVLESHNCWKILREILIKSHTHPHFQTWTWFIIHPYCNLIRHASESIILDWTMMINKVTSFLNQWRLLKPSWRAQPCRPHTITITMELMIYQSPGNNLNILILNKNAILFCCSTCPLGGQDPFTPFLVTVQIIICIMALVGNTAILVLLIR